MEKLKVSAKSNPNSVAGALAAEINENGKAEIYAIGASAVNQTIKAVAIARGFTAQCEMNLVYMPEFINIETENGPRTVIKVVVEPR